MQWTLFDVEDLGFKLNLTANFGVATYTCNGVGPDDLLRKATEALHRAEIGGNGVDRLKDEADG
jgi:PleD family two-component response regulator